MDDTTARKLNMLRKLARLDPDYRRLQNRLAVLEDEFDELVGSLSEKEQDTVWAYVFACKEEMQRMVEIACQFVEFEIK